MWDSKEMAPSARTILSVAASLTASAVLFRTIANDLVPDAVQELLSTRLRKLYTRLSPHVTVVIDEFDGLTPNQMFEAATVYLGAKLSSSSDRIKVNKLEKEKQLTVTIDKSQELVDSFNGAKFTWVLVCSRNDASFSNGKRDQSGFARQEMRHYELSAHKKHREVALNSYLPHVLEKAKGIKEERKSVKLHTVDYSGTDYWSCINLNHPATFETMAMNPETKKTLIEDLHRFISRKEYYRRVGKAWKRGYLLYGPPGTGKSSLVAAMANYLKFDIYDLDLKEVQCNSDLRRLLIGTGNRSILVIEDIDCSIELQNRNSENEFKPVEDDDKITLSALLNFIDGLWSSCGDARIVVFTTNHKDRLDPALLRPGRMDLHLHLSYCEFSGFKILAKNYLQIEEHPLFGEIEKLLDKAQATPAEISGELMKNDDAEASLQGLINFLENKDGQSLGQKKLEPMDELRT
ncbi:Spastin [Trema orientale]|uniref:Spastin n=1 Tax=Trema orientale TaxID=63057 RepID=A0A2P5F6K3_TREOI|nr:Spastin [Trema orientale]